MPLVLVLVLAQVGATVLSAPGTAGNWVLENDLCRLEWDREHGRLLRWLEKQGQVDLRMPEALAENFRLVVPSARDANNFVYGKDQTLSSCTDSSADPWISIRAQASHPTGRAGKAGWSLCGT